MYLMKPKTTAFFRKNNPRRFIVKGLPDVSAFIIPPHCGHIDRRFAVKRVDAQSW